VRVRGLEKGVRRRWCRFNALIWQKMKWRQRAHLRSIGRKRDTA
jgi:hypothetical protein